MGKTYKDSFSKKDKGFRISRGKRKQYEKIANDGENMKRKSNGRKHEYDISEE